MTGAQLSNYQVRMFNSIMNRRISEFADPQILEKTAAVIKSISNDLESVLPSKVARGYREAFHQAMLTGDMEFVRNVPKVFTPAKVRAGQVDRIFDKATLLPQDLADVANDMAQTGELFRPGGIEKFTDMAKERIYQHHLSAPSTFAEHFEPMLDDLLGFTPTSKNELNAKLNMVKTVVSTFRHTVSNTLQTAVSYGRQWHNSRAYGIFIDDFWDAQVGPSIGNVSNGLDQSIASLKRDIGQLELDEVIDISLKERYNDLFDNLLAQQEVWRKAREGYRTARTAYI